MTRITGLGSSTPVRSGGPAASGGSRGFMVATGSAPEISPAPPVVFAGLIALQEDEGPQWRDRTARRHGDRVLGALGQVQAATLRGNAAAALAALNDAVRSMTAPADPVLTGIIGAIRLRARVELARQEGVADMK